MKDPRLEDVLVALTASRDRGQRVVQAADEAIAAIRKLCGLLGAPALPPARAAAPPVTGERKAHRRVYAQRPRTAVCEECRETFAPENTVGRVPRCCSALCKNRKNRRAAAARAGVAPAPVPESGSGMRARIDRVAAGAEMPRSRFLEEARARNDEAARRSAGRPA